MGTLHHKDDPTATYRGYRRQALYCLFRLFDESLPDDFILQPEGNEDLAIRDKTGKLIEVVQVKDLSDNLTASKFKPTFYDRISEFCCPNSKVVVRIVSFGPIGPELSSALDNSQNTPSRVLETLTKDRETVDQKGNKRTIKGLPQEQAVNFLFHTQLTEVKESFLTHELISKLKNTITAGDPQRAFENLMWWLISSAESQFQLTRADVIQKLNQVGKYLSHIATFNQEWNTSIIPIDPYVANGSNRDKLESEFLLGGRVRVQHVAHNLDVRRNELLEKVHSSFSSENVVVVRAASGQGKTTLAYRYVLDYAPKDFRYEALRASDLRHARSMASAISGHSEAINIPTLIYVDVQPGDVFWIEFVRVLSATPDIRVLVTIREEDWFRSRASLDDFHFIDIPIDFDESSGREIYDLLVQRLQDNKYLDFDDAWSHLGERKTLFEFVYLLTQSESLASKIESQMMSLKDEINAQKLLPAELHLLQLVAVASAFEARINLTILKTRCEIPELQRTLDRFNKEFLVRVSDDGKYIEGFHAIRSELMLSQLIDPVLTPWGPLAHQVLSMLDEDGLELFLLCSFSRRPESINELLEGVKHLLPTTWIGIRGISIALQWIGLYTYANENHDLVKSVRDISGSGWWITLDWDLAQVKGKEGFKFFESLSNSSSAFTPAANVATLFKQKQTDKNEVFEYFRNWLEVVNNKPSSPTTISEFIALAEVIYWVGHLNIKMSIPDFMTQELLDKAFKNLPIDLFAKFAAATRKYSDATYSQWFDFNQDQIKRHICEEARIIALVEDEDALIGHYVIDLDRNSSVLRDRSTPSNELIVEINDLSVERVEILSACIPGFSIYGVNGYGHRMSFFNAHGDDSHKRMPIENIVMPWLPEFNSLSRGIVELHFRPERWNEYFQSLRSMREQVVAALIQLQEALQGIRLGKINEKLAFSDTESWDRCKAIVNGDFFLPKIAVDEWGFVSEGNSTRLESQRSKRFTAVSRLDPYHKAVNEYTRTVGHFMQHAWNSLILLPNLLTADSKIKRSKVLKEAKKLGIDEGSIRISVSNGIDACVAVNNLQRLEETLYSDQATNFPSKEFKAIERDFFLETMSKWCKFTCPEQFKDGSSKKKSRNSSRKKSTLKEGLKPTLNRIKTSLKKMEVHGIRAKVLSDNILWNGETTLWITFDTEHPIKSLIATEQIWHELVTTFKPDRNRIVRTKFFDYYWSRIACVPLIKSKSLEKQALPNMGRAIYPIHEKIEDQLWVFHPELIPADTWNQLGLSSWNRDSSWEVFDEFSGAYAVLFHHLDHFSDFARCKIDLDEIGEEILQEYVSRQAQKTKTIYQEALDAAAKLLTQFPDWTEDLVLSRRNLFDCAELLTQTQAALIPMQDSETVERLTIDEISIWRDRLNDGFELLAQARCLWIADTLELDSFDFGSF